jgi:hypothetical protein
MILDSGTVTSGPYAGQKYRIIGFFDVCCFPRWKKVVLYDEKNGSKSVRDVREEQLEWG